MTTRLVLHPTSLHRVLCCARMREPCKYQCWYGRNMKDVFNPLPLPPLPLPLPRPLPRQLPPLPRPRRLLLRRRLFLHVLLLVSCLFLTPYFSSPYSAISRVSSWFDIRGGGCGGRGGGGVGAGARVCFMYLSRCKHILQQCHFSLFSA